MLNMQGAVALLAPQLVEIFVCKFLIIFPQVRGPSRSNADEIVDDLLTPCSPGHDLLKSIDCIAIVYMVAIFIYTSFSVGSLC